MLFILGKHVTRKGRGHIINAKFQFINYFITLFYISNI